jgi:GT2 family glycosyltransferase
MKVTVAICIATRNRSVELERTLREVARLSPAPAEVLVLADGCTDGTSEMVRAKFPAVRVIAHEQARGSIPSRNELARATSCEVMLSLDDDSHPMETDFVAHVAELFAARPRLAVLSFPQRSEEFPETLTATQFGPAKFVGSYANSGAAIRCSVFLELGGYPEHFAHMYEEPDFALRCVSAGWEVWQDASRTIRHHFTGTQRDEVRNHQRHARNEFWSVIMRCPAPQVFAVAAYRMVRQLGYAWLRGIAWVLREPQWWLAALAGLPRALAERRALSWRSYREWMRLVGRPIESASVWREKFGGGAR